jgi:MFS family permease
VPSALLLLAAALCLVAGASMLREGPLGYAYLAGGAALAVAFVLLQRRLAQPLLNIRLLMQNRVLAHALFVQVVLYLNGFCAVFLLAIYIQVSLGHAANVAGEVLAIGTVLMTVLAPIAGRLADRYRPGLILTFGVGMVLASAAMGVTLSGSTSLLFVVLLLVVHGIGWALFSSPNMTVIMNSVPPDGRSIASALGATARTLGMLSGMLVTALLISLGLGNEPVDRHPVEFVAIMTQAFWFLTVVTTGLLVVCIRDGRASRTGAAA